MSTPLAPVPRLPYAVAMSLAGAVGVGAALLAVRATGGTGATAAGVTAALLANLALCAVPLLGPGVIKPHIWGLAVLLVSGLRTMLALAAMLVLIHVSGFERQPVVYGILAGTAIILFAEALVAAWLLTRRDRLRRAATPSTAAGASQPNALRSMPSCP